MTVEHDPACMETGERPRPKKRRLPRGEVHVFDNWCKGCGLCIEFCPAGVLVLGLDNRPKPIYPEKCTACRWCELHCPDFAIFVTDIEQDPECEPTDSEDSP
jgi:2-oxoglutarate ferredoxin oxidoreductase subunit delta